MNMNKEADKQIEYEFKLYKALYKGLLADELDERIDSFNMEIILLQHKIRQLQKQRRELGEMKLELGDKTRVK
jgi:hypothetical protein